MARNLYRFYLYVVYIGMLSFAATGIGRLLQLVFTFTPLKGASTGPTSSDIVQAIVFAIVSLVIAVPLCALHYWLIRRDIRSDPAAGSGGVRSFFLNFAEAISLLSGVFTASFVISSLGQPYPIDVTGSAAYTIVSLGFFALLEWERRRSQAAPGAAIVFQRIHFYGAQLILLIGLTVSWFSTVSQMLDTLLSTSPASFTCGPTSTSSCSPNLLLFIVSTLWIMLFWVGYGWLSRGDAYSLLRQVLHFISFAYGVGLALAGVNLVLVLALQTLFKVSVLPTYSPSALYSFVAPLTFGVVVVAFYSFWLSTSAMRSQAQRTTSFFIGEVIATAFLAISFWFGCGFLLFNIIEHIAPLSALDLSNLVIALASIIPGTAYIPLSLYLSRRSMSATVAGPRRTLVFSLLVGGILVSVGSAITLLYMLLTSLLGATLFDGWQHVAHGAGAGLIVGLLIASIYFWTARRERLLGAQKTSPATEAEVLTPKPSAEAIETAPATSTTLSIEDVLDALQAGKITRDEAAARIRGIVGAVR